MNQVTPQHAIVHLAKLHGDCASPANTQLCDALSLWIAVGLLMTPVQASNKLMVWHAPGTSDGTDMIGQLLVGPFTWLAGTLGTRHVACCVLVG